MARAPAAGAESPPEALPVRIPPLLLVVLVALVTPVFADLGGLRLSPTRVLFLALVPVLTIRLLMGRYGRPRLVDALMYLHVFWLALSIAVNNRDAFVTFVGSNALILLGGYLVGRATIRDAADMRGFALVLGTLVACSLPFAIYETVTARMVIPPLIDRLPFVFSNYNINYDRRLGFDRVQFVFAHPIHYGLWCSLAFSLVFVGLRGRVGFIKRTIWTAIIGVSTFLSLSSGPFLAMMTQLPLAAYGFATRRFAWSWKAFMIVFAIVYVILDLLSDRPAYLAIISRLTFSSSTTYIRYTLLQFGFRQIERTPFLGVGYNEWELPHYMTGSLDNYWLMTALVYGVPAFVFLFGAFLLTLIAAGRRPFATDGPLWNLRFGWALVMVGLGFALATVAVWSEMASMTFLMIGAGVWFADATETATDPAPAPAGGPAGAPSRAPRYSRFGDAVPAPPRRHPPRDRFARQRPSGTPPPEPAE